ncbi:MAG: alpha/beta-type small acid-soluble spore protein [Bacillota bacterium]|nr:alpha/beta-type small acid-soluble spore protein [Bacillota bacterium]
MAASSKLVPQARQALDTMKYEVANEIGVNLKQGYNGDLTSKEAGYVGGYMVRKMIDQVERSMSGK